MVDATTIIDYDYTSFREGIDAIANSVKASDFKPDYIVGIVRGGAVPAVHLSHKLKVPLVAVAWSTRDTSVYGRESNCWIPEDLHDGKKFEDWHTSTAGMGELPVDNLRVAAMYYNTAQDVKVDFYHRTIDRNEDQRWVVFPWEA